MFVTATTHAPTKGQRALRAAEHHDAIATSITNTQQASGEIPWSKTQHTDSWNMVEAAMGLTVAHRHHQAQAAYQWLAATQRPDGTWPMRLRGNTIENPDTDTNFTAYIATGIWHHYLITADTTFAHHLWPTVHAALNFVINHQQPDGTISWAVPHHPAAPTTPHHPLPALRTGNCSILRSLDSGLRLAQALAIDPHRVQPWVVAAQKLHHALSVGASFMPRRRFAMDWYYPVLAGVTTGTAGKTALTQRWSEFVVKNTGCRCVTSDPWVTAAETAELAIALCALNQHHQAGALLDNITFLQHHCGGYRTGYVYPDHTVWPQECTTWTAGAILLATDATYRTTNAHNLFAAPLIAP